MGGAAVSPSGQAHAVPIHSKPAFQPRRAAPSPEESEVVRVAARAAEDAGDFRGALRLVRRLPAGGPTERWVGQLERVLALPEDSPLRLAWTVHPAVRWARERPAGELLERHGRLLLTTFGVTGPERERHLSAVAWTDPVVLDAGLFDGGLFQRYLDEALDPALLAKASWLRDWPRQPMSVWRVERQDAGSAVLCDLWALDSLRVHAWPGMARVAPGSLVFGRLMPVPGTPRWTFALRPVRVDQRCANRLLHARRRGAEPQERLRAVARFRRRDGQNRAAA